MQTQSSRRQTHFMTSSYPLSAPFGLLIKGHALHVALLSQVRITATGTNNFIGQLCISVVPHCNEFSKLRAVITSLSKLDINI